MRRTLASLIEAEFRVRDCALLVGDVGYRVLDGLRGHCRFINCGASEQFMVAMASGLGLSGVFPIVYGIAPFVTARAFEQIKICLCQQRVPCLLVGTGAGFAYGQFGTTHHALEDVAALKALPGLTVLAPCDRADLACCFAHALRSNGPCYLRLPHEQARDVPQEPGIGLKKVARMAPVEQRPFAVVTYGAMVQSCLGALREDLPFDLFNINCLEATNEVLGAFRGYEAVVFVEEAYRTGGFGETLLARLPVGVRGVHRAVADRFPTVHGSREYLLAREGLDEASLRACFRAVSEIGQPITVARDLTVARYAGRKAYRASVVTLRRMFAESADPDQLLEQLLVQHDQEAVGLAAVARGLCGAFSARCVALLISALERAGSTAMSRISATLASGGEDVARYLAGRIQAAGPDLRIRILATLYRMNSLPEELAPQLVGLLDDAQSDVADWAEWVLARVGRPALRALIARIPGSTRAIRCVGLIGRQARELRDVLLERCLAANPEARLAVLATLSHLDCVPEMAISLLAQSLQDDDAAQIQAALRLVSGVARANRPNAQSVRQIAEVRSWATGLEPLLVRSLSHGNAWVRLRAAQTAEDLGPLVQGAEPILRAALSDPVPLVRFATARALGRTGFSDLATSEALIDRLADEDPDTGYAAAISLGSCRSGAEIATRLAESLGVIATQARVRSTLALGAIGSRAAHTWPELLKAQLDPEPEVRRWACWGLAEVEVRRVEVWDALVSALRDPDCTVRRQALLSLGRSARGRAEYGSPVAKLLTDPDEMVREAAAHTLLAIGADSDCQSNALVRLSNVERLNLLRATGNKLNS